MHSPQRRGERRVYNGIILCALSVSAVILTKVQLGAESFPELFAGSKNKIPKAQMPARAPASVQAVLLRPLELAMTQHRIASSKCTNAAVRKSEVGSISDLMKRRPEKYPRNW
jgi:hypothetical protein